MPRSILNKAALRAFAVEYAQDRQGSWFHARATERQAQGKTPTLLVATDFYVAAEEVLKKWIRERIRTHPSVGVTITTG